MREKSGLERRRFDQREDAAIEERQNASRKRPTSATQIEKGE
jgi:hypothetical protein